MRIEVLQHVPYEGPGSVRAWARRRGHALHRTALADGEPAPAAGAFDALVIMGGPMGVHDEAKHPWLREEKRLIADVLKSGRPVLGICLGAQMIAQVLGAKVRRQAAPEIGWFPVRRVPAAAESAIGSVLPDEAMALHWHEDTFDLPLGSVHLLRSSACENQAFAFGDRVLALQFHLEMTGEAAQDLVRYCGVGLREGPTVQPAERLLWEPGRFERANSLLDAILDRHLDGALPASPPGP